MFKKFLSLVLFVLLVNSYSFSQSGRTESMGGLSFSIIDNDQSLTPFNFGSNPAWLVKDETNTFLKITPFYSNSWGNYRPKYDSEGNSLIGTKVTGVKTLGQLGTFFGSTSYNYENRRQYFRTLKKDTYAGEAFYFTDSTSGDFSYTGPEVTLMYSWEALPRFYLGGAVYYEILEGLKQTYSYANTLYRKAGFNIGAAYAVSENFVVGTSALYTDIQESVEAADVNLLDVEMFNFRGDNYFFTKRGSSVTQKIRKKGFSLGAQLYWSSEKLSIGFQTNFSPANTRIILPFKTFSEDEEGYAAFDKYDIHVKTQYQLSDDLIIGAFGSLYNIKSWSRISKKNLMIWEWKFNQIAAGIGSTYKISPDFLAGFEYEFDYSSADSSKYIDAKFIRISSGNHLIRAGLEYQVKDSLFLRFGLNYGFNEFDYYTGVKDCNIMRFTFGVGFPLFDEMTINSFVEYSGLSPKNYSDQSRKFLTIGFSIYLNTF
jgi:hypothetical protein